MDKKFLAAGAAILIVLVALGIGISQNIEKLMNRNQSATLSARQAIEAHDVATFKKFVDTDALINQAAAEILAAQINETIAPTAYSMDALKMRYEELKPDFVNSARAAVDEYLATGKVTFPANLTDAQKFLLKSGATTCEIKSVTRPQKEGDVQFSTVIFHNTLMNFSFELELELTHDSDGNWRITSAKGFDDFYSGYRRALRRKLDSLNAPIIREMEEIFLVKGFKLKISDGDEYGFSQTLELLVTADVKSDRPLAKIVGTITLGKGERESITPFEIDMAGQSQGVQSFNVTKTLNPFIRVDVDAMKHGIKKSDVKIMVMEVIFADGTSLKQLDELPD